METMESAGSMGGTEANTMLKYIVGLVIICVVFLAGWSLRGRTSGFPLPNRPASSRETGPTRSNSGAVRFSVLSEGSSQVGSTYEHTSRGSHLAPFATKGAKTPISIPEKWALLNKNLNKWIESYSKINLNIEPKKVFTEKNSLYSTLEFDFSYCKAMGEIVKDNYDQIVRLGRFNKTIQLMVQQYQDKKKFQPNLIKPIIGELLDCFIMPQDVYRILDKLFSPYLAKVNLNTLPFSSDHIGRLVTDITYSKFGVFPETPQRQFVIQKLYFALNGCLIQKKIY